MNFSWMKAGSAESQYKLSDVEHEEIKSLIVLFSENALKSASIYVRHARRTIIQTQDLKNCLKLEAMIFSKKSNILQEAKQLAKEMFNDQDENSYEDIFGTQKEEYKKSECLCVLCKVINDINSFWLKWEPGTPLEMSLHQNIERIG